MYYSKHSLRFIPDIHLIVFGLSSKIRTCDLGLICCYAGVNLGECFETKRFALGSIYVHAFFDFGSTQSSRADTLCRHAKPRHQIAVRQRHQRTSAWWCLGADGCLLDASVRYRMGCLAVGRVGDVGNNGWWFVGALGDSVGDGLLAAGLVWPFKTTKRAGLIELS